MNAVTEQIEGAVIPLNLSVMYRFSWTTLELTLRYFFCDESLELGDDEPLGTPLLGETTALRLTDRVYGDLKP